MSTRRILKWTVPVDGQNHHIDSGPIVHIACTGNPDEVHVWTDTRNDPNDGRTVRVYATGQPLPDTDITILGTAIYPSRVFPHLVWHLVEVHRG